MSVLIRDTQFGRLLRLLSRKRVLRYPDEVDPALWKSATQRASSSGDRDIERKNDTTINRTSEEVFMVDWSGPDDPEVSQHPNFDPKHSIILNEQRPEPTELVEPQQAACYQLDLSHELHLLPWELHLHVRHSKDYGRVRLEYYRCHARPFAILAVGSQAPKLNDVE